MATQIQHCSQNSGSGKAGFLNLKQIIEQKEAAKQNKDEHEKTVMRKEKQKILVSKEQNAVKDEIEKFKRDVKQSDDLSDLLKELTVFLKKQTNATGIYIGKLVQPNKPITDDGDDTAHLDSEAKEVV